MTDSLFDLCVIGGGINGCGIARDAAGRGLSVALIEAEDLAGGTSSASTKLIHGGLRYLENHEWGMVRSALREREILFRTAQHLVRPLEFVLPHTPNQRPLWMIRSGLFLYDHLGGRTSFKNSKQINLTAIPHGKPLKSTFKKGFLYMDCWGDDTRLVIQNAVDAAARGAQIMTRSTCESVKLQNGVWNIGVRDGRTGTSFTVYSKMLVNATGPWVQHFLKTTNAAYGEMYLPKVRLVKGSHIILPRQHQGEHAYILQQLDGRIIFVIPYEKNYTLIGTTEEDYSGNPRDVMITKAEIEYLCKAYNQSFEKPIGPQDVVFTYSGVRPLFDDGKANASKISRDYRIHHHKKADAPFLSLYGGKLTTYRILAEKTVDKLLKLSGRFGLAWTAHAPLSGGNFPQGDFQSFLLGQKECYPWLPPETLYRYARAYGTNMNWFLEGKECMADLGRDFGDGIYEAEIRHLLIREWAEKAEDVLWRRSKLGLHVSESTVHNIEDYFEDKS